ncbi:MAG: oxidoreductase [Candidatus Marinimicrobia bacterium]|nr:oxidoreductase [Candidatus Neomarinimicrobiota bacterium]
MKRQALFFIEPGKVEIREETCPEPASGELLIQTVVSAISPGTEMLIYNNQIPDSMPLDSSISELQHEFRYPVKYGYANVGTVVKVGKNVSEFEEGERIVSFHPHESHFILAADEAIKIPESLDTTAAALLPNMETAVNFLMDGSPIIGEDVAIFGQGIVGLLTTHLVAQHPMGSLVTFENIEVRRELSRQFGAAESLASSAIDTHGRKYDLVYELTGNPETINQALAVCGLESRIIIGSWYGNKVTPIALGETFHRNRIQIISSQVSTIRGKYRARWDKKRRLTVAINQLNRLDTNSIISHRIPFSDASDAYALYDSQDQNTLQILLTY